MNQKVRQLKQAIQNAEYEVAKLERELKMTPASGFSYRARTAVQIRNQIWYKQETIKNLKDRLWKAQ